MEKKTSAIKALTIKPVLADPLYPLAKKRPAQKGAIAAAGVKYASTSPMLFHIPNSSAVTLLVIIRTNTIPVATLNM
jgi:hypothetical protein